MNLIVIDKCSNYCAYCFASTEMGKSGKKTVLTREGIERVVQFISRSGPNFRLNIIGGEPFLYKDLVYLLEKSMAEPALGDATIFTGGICNTNEILKLKPYRDRLSLLVNLNERRDYRRNTEYELVLHNIDVALNLGIPVNIGFNIWRQDFNYQEILDVCESFGIEYLRWTVAYPELNPSPEVQVLSPSEYHAVAPRIAEFLEAAYWQHIQVYLDCPLPKCFFTSEQLGRIQLTQPKSAAFRSCGPVIDVNPALEVFRCYALSDLERTQLTDFDNFSELMAYYKRVIDEKYDRPQVYDRCDTCEFAEDRSCYGGCMANSAESIGGRESQETLLKIAYQAIQQGRGQEAEVALKKVFRKDAGVSLLWAHRWNIDGDISQAKVFARQAVNRSRTVQMRAMATTLLQQLSASGHKQKRELLNQP
ncbi:radical SAM protein [Arthrospira platensis]|jgi:cyclic pyranopterin phosphate synthase|uniref:Radical SAM core domain-containing protein n=1 Tax=Limnospira platensis NIES-46 TaxID=1236695 RepID=A0A5M3TAM8_LIMPL|nr:radical SAM protein [Arthrospira platensis]AMW31329.1 radical SAM protein [Arthrospira platensis YZ]KDR56993.1 radical SAM protein [Arthrospira platensis str. Paraca]MBD2671537.1 radical SAM protein [Arthrospira platensis FACHB-439]MBD2712465.1 radical SAM protein [Arthrospira platensis FACHB-835]MDF2208800.1 radical SAM protein [Arthrospira platensis NCB002]MDT9185312.1 radical SAM protein [Limnospira sp. PMC 289.06]MDT9297545.1 radical SAM protein [Arthrospira platensis PCC 7345]MDT931